MGISEKVLRTDPSLFRSGRDFTAEHAESAEGEEVRTYGHNTSRHLVSILSQTPQATSEASYQYSYDGKRISKYIDGTLYDYTYTGNNLLETYTDTAGRIAKYIYGHALISQSVLSGTPTPTPNSYSIQRRLGAVHSS